MITIVKDMMNWSITGIKKPLFDGLGGEFLPQVVHKKVT